MTSATRNEEQLHYWAYNCCRSTPLFEASFAFGCHLLECKVSVLLDNTIAIQYYSILLQRIGFVHAVMGRLVPAGIV
eukprot:COSAG02_NODE_985_length_15457_cov_108.738247_16_plen_77_part_00